MKNNIENKSVPTVKIVAGRQRNAELSNIPLTKERISESFWMLTYKKAKRVVEVLLLEDEYLDSYKRKDLK